MANFTCDICGGAIKMQGSQGGVCQTCGMEYDLEAIRAKVNAAQQQAVQPAVIQPAPQNAPQDAMDRESLLIYLNDLRTMETIVLNSDKSTEEYEKKVSYYNGLMLKQKKDLETAVNKDKELENSGTRESSYQNKAIVCFIICALSFLLDLSFAYQRKDHSTLLKLFLVVAVVFLIFGLVFLRKYRSDKELYESARARDIERSKKEVEVLEKEYDKKVRNYEKWKDRKSEIDDVLKEKNDISEMLKEAYDANIIPLQFRTIEGVYYLYDYLSTSNQTLAEALLQANLEAIKQRLEQVIATQGKLIIEQQQTNAQLANIQQTNQQILETAKQTAANTAQAAQYAQIAATNTELLTKLNKKQLAYQRADFWLK